MKRKSKRFQIQWFWTYVHLRWLSFGLTTEDIKANCEDLKVLGKGDFKTLIKWRASLREEAGHLHFFFVSPNNDLV